jgi:hypothetical protein
MRVPPGAKQEEDKKEESRGERVLYASRVSTSPGSAAVQSKKLVTLLNVCSERSPSDVVMRKGVEIKLNSVSRQKGGGANKARFSPVLLIAKLDLPQISKARTICAEDDTKSDIMSEDSEDQGKILLELRRTCLANSCCVRILQFAAFDIQRGPELCMARSSAGSRS